MCFFCSPNPENITCEAELSYVHLDGYPVSVGHSLVVPKRHINSLGELTNCESKEMYELINQRIEELKQAHNPDGFNIGINLGESAGQTISHLHIHIIPRYVGDVYNPRGGVRGVIPDKQNY